MSDVDPWLCALVGPRWHRSATDIQSTCADWSPQHWAQLEQLVIRQGLAGLVSSRLQSLGLLVPPTLLRTARRQWAKNQVLLRSLASISTLFQQWGIAPWCPLKGLVVLPTVYGDLGDRANNDVDILVHPTQFAKAVAALMREGFHPVTKDPAHPWSQWASYERSLAAPTGVVVDVHRALGYRARVAWDEAGLWDRMVSYPALKPWAPCALSPEDMWLHLLAHQAQDGFCGPLRQWVDVAFWVNETRPDPELTARRAVEMGMGTIFGWSVGMLERLWGMDIGRRVSHLLPGPGIRRWLLDRSFPPKRVISDRAGEDVKAAKRWTLIVGTDSARQPLQMGLRHFSWRGVDALWNRCRG